ncbi:hypothetical protein BT69DRAFT_1329983 [Atractiella rhizophila]|nr:hypothetical protein BT69DRAFT_1329983 [Atractiella rhizophila]
MTIPASSPSFLTSAITFRLTYPLTAPLIPLRQGSPFISPCTNPSAFLHILASLRLSFPVLSPAALFQLVSHRSTYLYQSPLAQTSNAHWRMSEGRLTLSFAHSVGAPSSSLAVLCLSRVPSHTPILFPTSSSHRRSHSGSRSMDHLGPTLASYIEVNNENTDGEKGGKGTVFEQGPQEDI